LTAESHSMGDHKAKIWSPPRDDFAQQLGLESNDHGRSEQRAVNLPVVSAATFAGTEVAPRHWIVKDMIPSGTVTIAAGDGGVGKSTLLLQLGAAVASGREWIGATTEQAPVVFVSAEDDLEELHRRLATIAGGLGVDLADLRDLHIIPLAGRDAVMGATDGKTGTIKETSVWRGLVVVVKHVKPCLVILDTLADVFGGNENARQEARQFIGLLRGLAIDHRLAIVLIAHPSLSGLSTGTGTSGSTAWNNSARSRLYLETVKDRAGRELDADHRILRVKKSNYGPAGREIPLRWSNGCFTLAEHAGGFDKFAADAKAEGIFLELLSTLAAQGRDVSAKPSRTYAPAIFAKNPAAHGLPKAAFDGAMERLLASGRIRIDNFGPPSKPRSRLALVSQPAIES
jgi:RecA-family ATPase